MRPQSTMRDHLVIRLLVVLLLTTLLPGLITVGVANAAGPSVDLPPTKSVVVTKPTVNAPPPDAASANALSGNQDPKDAKDGAGTSKATTLSPSSTWDVSEQTGDFSLNYPFRVPPAAGGFAPNLALSYRSSAVDGRTSAANNQPSWVGDGWDMSPGFVERTYGGCAEDAEGDAQPPQVGDLCWRNDNATASFEGGGGMLIRDDKATPEVWRAKNDNGARIERLFGRNNGDNDGEYWKITTLEGTQYFFGSETDSSSAWTVPVFGDDANEPCHGASFDSSRCTQAWRWNLDKVIDRNGNVIRYFYEIEKNKYGLNMKDTAVEYDRGGLLKRIDYGLHQDTAAVASGRVEFATADRCLPGSVCDADKKEHWGNWPDTPLDNRCVADTCAKQNSPSFWSTKRLASITTRVWKGTDYSDVDRWELDQQYPDPGDGERAALWLKGIKHVGLAGGTLELPWVRFIGSKFANRVEKIDGMSPLIRYRLTGIMSETGGITSISYAEPDCTATSLPENAWTNTKRCFPVTWNKKDHAVRTDHFHKYVVDTVVQSDRLNTSTPQVTRYEYIGGAAWHWDRSEFTKDDKKTWNEFRGFGRVRVRVGSDRDLSAPTMAEQFFHRGMDGDRLNRDGGVKSVVLRDSAGNDRTDHERFISMGYESRSYERSVPIGSLEEPPLVGKTITEMWSKGPTATRGPFEAYMVRPSAQRQFTALKPSGWRETRTETTYDDLGLPVDVSDLGDVSTNDDDQCTRTRYVRNTNAWLLNLPSTVETVSVACNATVEYPLHAVSATRNSYDGLEFGAAPTKGNPSKVEVVKDRAGAQPTYATVSKAVHDIHGRVIEGTDAAGSVTKTKFTPLTGGPVTQVEATSPPTLAVPKGMVTTTQIEPAFGQVITVTDANNRTTETAYDPLGRKIEVWLANRPRAKHARGNFRFSYQVNDTKPTVVTSWKIGPTGVHTSSKAIFDGLLRPRQTQSPAPGGGRLITDTVYDSQGRVYKTTQPYFNDAPLDDELWEADDAEIPGHTRTEFDSAGRPTASVYYAGAVEKWRTRTDYGGDRVHVTPPNGGTATTTIRDARGRMTELRQYQAPTPTGDYDSTTYRYNQAGYLSEVVAPGNAIWRFGYDLRGNKVRTEDPDSGVSTMTYDDAGRLATTTDARGITLAVAYDTLSRKTATHEGSLDGPKLSEWVYDTARGGKGQLASSTRFVASGTERHAYTTSISSYTSLYQPNDTSVTIPAAQGMLAGKYTWYGSYGWDSSLSGEAYPAAGDLAAESVNYVHDDEGKLLSSSGNDKNGTVELVTSTLYTRYGETERVQLGAGTKRVWVSNYYDSHTRRLERSVVDAESPKPMQSDVRYTYNDAGFTTSITEAAPGQADKQCFKHDHLGRLTEAWTPQGECTEPSTTLGGAAPYWHSYKYDKTGNRKEEVRHTSTGDTVKTFDYPDPASPHRLREVKGGAALETFDYDASGNTIKRTKGGIGETLKWDAEGHLESVTNGDKVTSFIYNAEGSRLLRKDPDGTTLYLGNQEIRLSAKGGSPAGTRYYAYGGNVIAVRVGTKLTWLTGHQRATELAIDSATMEVTRRRQLPFGAPRGTTPTIWPDDHGFLGATKDPSTGLTHLGAREYDTELGRFISVDPLMDPTNPQQMHGYSYANNSPVTLSDPSGLMPNLCGLVPGGCLVDALLPVFGNGNQSPAPSNGGRSPVTVRGTGSAGMDEARGLAHDIMINAKRAGFRTQYTYYNILVQVPTDKARPGAQYEMVPGVIIAMSFSPAPLCVDPNDNTNKVVARADPMTRAERELYNRAHPQPPPAVAPMTLKEFLGAVTGADAIVDCIRNPSFGGCLAAAAPFAAGALGRVAVAAGGRVLGTAGKVVGRGCSFVPGTQVLMADGSYKPIEEVQVGDMVLATDPETGETGPRVVLAPLTGEGVKNLVQITIDTDGQAGDQTGTLTATDNHPFWAPDLQKWVSTAELHVGSLLQTSEGSPVQVTATRSWTARQRVHNLTVDDLHTYYVPAGATPVLVHNSNGLCGTAALENGGWQHIVDRHRPGGALVDDEAGIFTGKAKHVRQRIADTINRGTPRPNPPDPVTGAARPGQIYEWDFGTPVGRAGSANGGGELTAVRVIVNDGKVVTAFPY